jgi:hypothetical protein
MASRLNMIMKYELIQKLVYYLCAYVSEVTYGKWIEYYLIKYHVLELITNNNLDR